MVVAYDLFHNPVFIVMVELDVTRKVTAKLFS